MEIYVSPEVDSQSVFLNFSLPQDPTQQVFELPFGLIDTYFHFILKQAIVHSVSIGACVILMLTLIIFPKKNKNNPMFYLNLCSLLWMIIRSVLNIVFIMGPLYSPSFSFTGLVNPETSTYSISTAANSSEVVLVFFILASINYQIFIIFKSPEVKKMGLRITLLATAMSLTTIGLYINSTVQNNTFYHNIFAGKEPSETFINGRITYDLPRIMFYTTINLTSVALIFKLISAVRTRRYLGLKQFDAFHILLIMSTQTFLIPTIIVFIHYGYGSSSSLLLLLINLLLVVVSLPLSSLWAASANNKSAIPSSLPSSSLSFLARFLTNSSTSSDKTVSTENSSSDNATMVGSTVYSMFPEKLAKFNSQPSTSSSPNTFRNQLPRELADLLNEEEEEGMSATSNQVNTPYSTSNAEDIDAYLNNINDNEMVAVTKHNAIV